VPTGLIFDKQFIFEQDGRPVVYDKTASAKDYLPESKWWRIVNFDLSNSDNIIDWTHEPEWRVSNLLEFKLSDVSLLFSNDGDIHDFIQLCDQRNTTLYKEVHGITSMQMVVS
jgi:hypothetical protein